MTGQGYSDRVRVLHVDDNQAMVDLVASMLTREDESLRVTTATSADEALSLFGIRDGPPDREPAAFDCVVSDYQMPVMDGLEFLDELRESYPDLPFILFTGKGSEEIASDAISAGVTEYLQKESGTDQYAVLANRIRNVVQQRRAQETLEAERNRFRALLGNSSDVIAVIDEDGVVRYQSPSTKRILGYKPHELVGEVGLDRVHPEDLDRTRRRFTEFAESDGEQLRRIEYRFRHGDGHWIWLESVTNGQYHEEAGGYVISSRDVTDRREREAELERRRDTYRQLMDLSPAPTVIFDEDVRILYANDAAVKLTHVDDPAELVGDDLMEYGQPDDTDRIQERFRRVLEDREPVGKRTVHLVNKDGDDIHLASAIVPVTYEGHEGGQLLLNDVTEEVTKRRELEQSRRKYQALIETAPDAIFVADAETGEIVTVNERATELMDAERDDLVGSHQTELHPEEHAERYAAVFESHVNADDAVMTEQTVGEQLYVDTGAEWIPVEISASVVELEGERLIQGVFRDVTDRKERISELKRQRERLEEFTSVVSRDLRDPLSVAKGEVELTKRDGDLDRLDSVETALDRMDELITDMLALAERGTPVLDLTEVGLDETASTVWNDLDVENATLAVDSSAVLRAEADRLRHLLEQLFRNAVQHGRHTGDAPMTVAVGVLDDEESWVPEDGIAASRDGGRARERGPTAAASNAGAGFYVEDDGAGLADETVERVFEPGFSTGVGTGFGLSIVAEIADAHGWQVSVTESDRGGARFEVRGVEM